MNATDWSKLAALQMAFFSTVYAAKWFIGKRAKQPNISPEQIKERRTKRLERGWIELDEMGCERRTPFMSTRIED